MENDIIREFWEIRGMLDLAVDNQDLNLYNKARDRFYKIFKNEEHLKSISTSSVQYEFDDFEEMLKDREENFAMIAFDFGHNLSLVKGEEVDEEEISFKCVMDVIWYTRWMFGNFIKNNLNNENQDVNMKIYQAIVTNIKETISYYEDFNDAVSNKEKITLNEILDEVVSYFNELNFDNKNIIN